MGLMNNLKHTLKETFKPRKRRAVSGILVMIMGIVIGLAGVALVATTLFDVTDTASVIDSIEITSPVVYANQGYVSVQVKNNGNTAIDGVYAVLLVDTADTGAAAGNTVDCAVGAAPLAISTLATSVPRTELVPSESVTISGGLTFVPIANVPTTGGTSVITATGNSLLCDGDANEGTLAERNEYVIQVNGFSDGDPISKTTAIRSR